VRRAAGAVARRAAAVALPALAVALPALLLAGCGGSHQTPRAAVARYVTQVNAVESQLAPPLVSVTRTVTQFAGGRSASPLGVIPSAEAAALSRAGRRIGTLRARLAAIPAPAPAGHLRSLLLRLVDRQAALTRQMSKLVVFLPRFSLAMAPLRPSLIGLERVLGVTKAAGPAAVTAVYAEKAAALRRFRAALEGMLVKLRRLDPPVVSRPPFQAQVRALEGMSRAAGGLAGVLGAGNQAAVARLLMQFDRAAAGPVSRRAHQAQVMAVRAYDKQLTSLNHLAEQASRERLRLAKTLS
jgi:hypothetical protein